MFQNTHKRAMRRGWPIMGYVGANGGGKSAAMVWDTLPSLEAGRPVLSTVRLLDYENPRECEGCEDPDHFRPVYGPVLLGDALIAYLERVAHDTRRDPSDILEQDIPTHDENGFPLREVVDYVVHQAAHPLYVRFHRWEQLLDAKGCDALMDEVTGVGSSRESQSMPAPVANKLVQLRRADVVLRWSSPAWARADKIIRECSQAVTFCTGRMPVAAKGAEADRMWRQRRLFSWKTYDAADFEDFTAGKREQLPALQRDWHWGPKSPVFAAYDTYDAVSTVGTVSDAGRCYRCGGTRRAPACSCPEHQGGPGGRVSRRGPRASEARGVPGDPVPGRHSVGHET